MASQKQPPLYPQVIESNPETASPFFSNPNLSSSSIYPSFDSAPSHSNPAPNASSLYPSIDTSDLVENLFPDADDATSPQPPAMESVEEVLLTIPGAILHLIDDQKSVHLASGDLSVVRLRQGDNVVAALVRIEDQIQWPLAKDEATVKLDDSHYFFTLRVPGDDDLLNYGLTIASKGQDHLLKELDEILQLYSCFSVQKVTEKSDVLDGWSAKEISPAELKSSGEKEEMMEERSAAYWTTLAPNVEDYSGSVARAIAAGSGQLIKGILWCGDVTVDRLKWGNDFLRKRTNPCAMESEVSPAALKRIKRVKRISKMSESVATGVLSGVLKVSGFFTSSIANSKAGKKFFSLLPGEIVLASLDGFSKVCDAFEVSGKNVMSTTSVVTTELVSHRYGEKAAEATSHGLDAAGHAIGTAWAVFKIRKAFNPKSAIKPTALTKAAAKAAIAGARSKQRK